MKIHIGFALLAVVIASLTTLLTCHLRESMRRSREVSLAGQTLTDLLRAIERSKEPDDPYPESIEGIVVGSASGDFSRELLRHVIYRRTEKGYVAFVGLRGVAYIDQNKSVRFDFVDNQSEDLITENK